MGHPFTGSAAYTHTDLGKFGTSDPIGHYLDAYLAAGHTTRADTRSMPLLWSYEVPAGTKLAVQTINVVYAHRAALGGTLSSTLRDGQGYRMCLPVLQADAVAVFEWEGKGAGLFEGGGTNASQFPLSRDSGAPTKLDFGDGLQFTAGQVLTIEANVQDPGLSAPGMRGGCSAMRLFGKNTATGAFMSIEARLYPSYFGTAQMFWWNNVESELSYTVPSGGFTLLSATLRTDFSADHTLTYYNVLYLNDIALMEIGMISGGLGRTIDPVTIYLGGVELMHGDLLELRGSMAADAGQTVSVTICGMSSSLATYPRSRVNSP